MASLEQASLSHAFGTSHPQKRVALYNSLLARYVPEAIGEAGSVASLMLRNLASKYYPALADKLSEYSKPGIGTVAAILFPTPQCPACDSKLEEFNIRRPYCNMKCWNRFLHGVDHHTQLESTQEARKQTTLTKYGVENVSQAKAIQAQKRATCRENFGVDYPQQSKTVRATRVKNTRKRYGVDSIAQLPQVRAKFRAS